ncbi:MAG: hypothetical protein QT04_C0008G0006 [archaeon GW2011_AR11]|nr:MAG: hypothetical protein QT04_C0008G0006 [archaeon GW2011_AR11]
MEANNSIVLQRPFLENPGNGNEIGKVGRLFPFSGGVDFA